MQRLAKACFFETPLVRIRFCRHGVFAFLRTDTVIGRSLDRYGEWCEHELKSLRRFVASGSVVLDIGANIGTHAIYFSQCVGTKGRVLAFEPQTVAVALLHMNVVLNGRRNVRVFHAACGATPGRVVLKEPPVNAKRNVGRFALRDHVVSAEGLKSIDGELSSVDVLTIDGLELGRCDFIKIDVEGMELSVLEGGILTIQKHRPVLWVENNDSDTSHDLIGFLLDIGYVLYWHLDSRYNTQNYYGCTENIFLNAKKPSANMACIPVERLEEFPGLGRDSGLIRVQGVEDNWKEAWRRLNKSV